VEVPLGLAVISLSRTNPTRKILIRADVIAGRLKRTAYQLKDDITSALTTAWKDLMLPQEYLMRWAVAEVQNLVDSGDADVFARHAKHVSRARA
jgi:hypothetical protein